MTAKLDWKWGLVGLGFFGASMFGVREFGDNPAVLTACVGLIVATATAIPSWLFHRGES